MPHNRCLLDVVKAHRIGSTAVHTSQDAPLLVVVLVPLQVLIVPGLVLIMRPGRKGMLHRQNGYNEALLVNEE